MCEAVKEYAKEYAEQREMDTKLDIAKNLMKESGFTLEHVLKVLNVGADQRELFLSKLQM